MYTTAVSCFDEPLIGLRGCSNPSVKHFIDKIGIHEGELNQLITEPYKNAQGLFDDMQAVAIEHVVNEVHLFYNKAYKANTIIDGLRIGKLSDNNKTLSGLTTIKGIEIELHSDSYLDLFISEFNLYSDAASQVVNVWDLQLNRLIDSFTVTNETTFLNRTYTSRRKKLHLFFGYDTTGVTFSEVLTKTGCCNPGYSNSFIKAWGGEFAAAEDKIKSNITHKSDTGGISLVYSLNCNHSEWLCTIRDAIALPVLYKTAALLMEFGANVSPNERINTTVTINQEKLAGRAVTYGLQYEALMKTMLGKLKLPDDTRCFECKQNIKHGISIP